MRNKVLIADDIELSREILSEMLEDDFIIVEASNGREALELIENHADELVIVLLDLVMPELDGFRVLEAMNERHYMQKLPVLVISSESREAEERCFNLGVSDFIRKPFDQHIVKRRVKNAAELYTYKNHLEDIVEEQTRTLEEQNKQLRIQEAITRKSYYDIIDIMGTVVEARSMESGEHIKRVKGYTDILAQDLIKRFPEYGLTESDVELIVSASPLHDIGKIMIPDSILLKPGRFTPDEFAEMKKHSAYGCEIISNIHGAWSDAYGKASYEICRYHHERWDGRGYPDNLTGDDIPISAQLVSVADVYDALVSERCYKKPVSTDKAYEMIITGACGAFNPKLMECFSAKRADFEDFAHTRV